MVPEFKTWNNFVKETGLDSRLDELLNNLDVLYENTIVYPEKNQVFRAFSECEYDNTKVVILAMDPYPGVYKNNPSACGVAFATENGYINPSLKIIFEELKRTGFPIYGNPVYQAKSLFNWCEQGVLLLNASLTVEQGLSGSHSKIWKPFTEHLITSLSKKRPDIIWLLMGRDAQKFKTNIVSGNILEVVHPMSDQYSGKKVFVGSDVFININKILIKNNKTPIEWGNKDIYYKNN